MVWIGLAPEINFYTKHKKGQQWEMAKLIFYANKGSKEIEIKKEQAIWLMKILYQLSENFVNFQWLKQNFEAELAEDFEPFWYSKQVKSLKNYGLLTL